MNSRKSRTIIREWIYEEANDPSEEPYESGLTKYRLNIGVSPSPPPPPDAPKPQGMLDILKSLGKHKENVLRISPSYNNPDAPVAYVLARDPKAAAKMYQPATEVRPLLASPTPSLESVDEAKSEHNCCVIL